MKAHTNFGSLVLLISSTILLIATSCSEKNNNVNLFVSKFLASINNEDTTLAKKYYPKIMNFGKIPNIDSAKIESIKNSDSTFYVQIKCLRINDSLKKSNVLITLFIKKIDTTFIIYDSKNIIPETSFGFFGLSKQFGCLNKKNDTTDIQKLKASKSAEKVFWKSARLLIWGLPRDIRIVDFNWESTYDIGAFGRSIFKNNSNFTIINPKYKVTYMSYKGDIITTDEGIAFYGNFYPGDIKSFTFHTSYIGDATRAKIELDLGVMDILEILANWNWKGTECEEFFKNNPDIKNDIENL